MRCLQQIIPKQMLVKKVDIYKSLINPSNLTQGGAWQEQVSFRSNYFIEPLEQLSMTTDPENILQLSGISVIESCPRVLGLQGSQGTANSMQAGINKQFLTSILYDASDLSHSDPLPDPPSSYLQQSVLPVRHLPVLKLFRTMVHNFKLGLAAFSRQVNRQVEQYRAAAQQSARCFGQFSQIIVAALERLRRELEIKDNMIEKLKSEVEEKNQQAGRAQIAIGEISRARQEQTQAWNQMQSQLKQKVSHLLQFNQNLAATNSELLALNSQLHKQISELQEKSTKEVMNPKNRENIPTLRCQSGRGQSYRSKLDSSEKVDDEEQRRRLSLRHMSETIDMQSSHQNGQSQTGSCPCEKIDFTAMSSFAKFSRFKTDIDQQNRISFQKTTSKTESYQPNHSDQLKKLHAHKYSGMKPKNILNLSNKIEKIRSQMVSEIKILRLKVFQH